MGYRGRYNRTGEETPIGYDEIKRRAYRYIKRNEPHARGASSIGQAIWPKNTMHAQGLGLAGAKQVSRLVKDGLVSERYDVRANAFFLFWVGPKPDGA